jgi:hypothetical protein
MRREAMGVFEEEMCKVVVAEQLALLDDGRIRKEIVLVDLEYHCRWYKRAEKEINII